jgi:hypothetical protein
MLIKDLSSEFDNKGFSSRNLFYVQKWYLFYSQQKVQQLVALFENKEKFRTLFKEQNKTITQQLVEQIPWGHNREIITKCQNIEEAIFYVIETISWFRTTKNKRRLGFYQWYILFI